MPYLKYILGLTLFGTNGLVAHNIALSSYQIVLCRTGLGLLFLLIVYLLTYRRLEARDAEKTVYCGCGGNAWDLMLKGNFDFLRYPREIGYLFLAGFALAGNWLVLYEGYNVLGVGLATLCVYSGPVLVMLLSPLLFKEKLYPSVVFCFCLVVIGFVLLNQNMLLDKVELWGIFLGIMCALTYCLLVIFNKLATHIQGIENTMLQFVAALVLLIPFVGYQSGLNFVIDSNSVPYILLLGVVNTGVGCYLYMSSINVLPVQSVSVIGYIEPLMAVFLSALFLGEQLTPLQLLGGGLILGGAILAEALKRHHIST